MSAGGGRRRALAAELLQRLRVSPRQWDDAISWLEKALSVRVVGSSRAVESGQVVAASAVERERSAAPALEQKADKSNEVVSGAGAAPPETRAESPQTKPAPAEPMAAPPGEVGVGADASHLTMSGLLQGLRRKKDLALGNLSASAWKSNKPIVNKTSIHSRTAYVISALVAAQSAASRAKRAADFIHHVNQYPEARDYAIKEGAVRALLRVQHAARHDDPVASADLHGLVDEALALMGWVGAPRGAGVSVLALDGGGIRGLVAIEILRELERLTARPAHELFDYIIGVSTGAIIAAVIGSGAGSLEAAARLYRSLSRDMFGDTTLLGGTSRLVWTHSYYDTARWERMLRDQLGDVTLSQCNRARRPKLALVSCVVNAERVTPFVFRSYSAGFRRRGALRGTSDARLWEAVRASAAAPTYFQEFTLGADVHQDGGIVLNNPCGVGVHEARLLWGAEAVARGTVLSIGTGRAPAAPRGPRAPPAPTSWKDKFNKILESATDTEGAHLLLSELLPPDTYCRLNPPLVQPCNMDEVDPARLHQLLEDTRAYMRRNQHKMRRLAARLLRPRPLLRRAADALQHRALLLGLTQHN